MSKLHSLYGRCLAALLISLPFNAQALLISEVYYDHPGVDNGFEWVELYNNNHLAIDLSGYSLGYGGDDYTTGSLALSGIIASGAYFVIGGPSNIGITFDLSLNFNPDLQNSGTDADGIALFSPTAQIVDAVIYGAVNINDLLDETGLPGAVDVGDAPAGSSIERISLTGLWQIQSAPTPGTGPLPQPQLPPQTPPTGELFEPAPLTLLLPAIMMMAILAYRRQRRGGSDERAIPTCSFGNGLTA